VKINSAVKTLISGTTSRYPTFTLIVARCYHQKFAAAAQLLIKPKNKYKDDEKLFIYLNGQVLRRQKIWERTLRNARV
jgi:hypothetical protein